MVVVEALGKADHFLDHRSTSRSLTKKPSPTISFSKQLRTHTVCIRGTPIRMQEQKRAKILSRGVIATTVPDNSFAVPGLLVDDYTINVPLDWTGETPGEVPLFFRVVTHSSKRNDTSMPYLLYIQGGPGYESPRPTDTGGWVKSAINSFRVVYMDQRGTGRSAGISPTNLAEKGTPQQQSDYLKYFRADSIVKDAEAIRKYLVPATCHGGKWSIMGQSFGGFCCLTYLSFASEGLIEVLMTGGIPPGIDHPMCADAVYQSTFQRVLQQNAKYYDRFPSDISKVQAIVQYLMSQPEGGVTTPMGNRLTPRSFQLLGLSSVGFAAGFERLHYLIEAAFETGTSTKLSQRFLKDFETWMSWDTNPLYAILHESIYCQGAASQWSAHRVREKQYAGMFDAAALASTGSPVMFTGEHVFPWMFDDFVELRKIKEAAEITANRQDWPMLYDVEALKRNTVPVAAASYYDDIFVDFNLAQETIAKIGGARQVITNELLHDGIRESGGPLFDKLLNIVRGSTLLR